LHTFSFCGLLSNDTLPTLTQWVALESATHTHWM
jgi:hypothetical protein